MEKQYEVHVSGLPPHIVPFAFPEAIVVRTGDVSVLEGLFDLNLLGRRIALFGGQVLAVFADNPTPTGGTSAHLE